MLSARRSGRAARRGRHPAHPRGRRRPCRLLEPYSLLPKTPRGWRRGRAARRGRRPAHPRGRRRPTWTCCAEELGRAHLMCDHVRERQYQRAACCACPAAHPHGRRRPRGLLVWSACRPPGLILGWCVAVACSAPGARPVSRKLFSFAAAGALKHAALASLYG